MTDPATKDHPPPRISVLLAAEAPVGMVFRRGPSKLVRVIHWDRATDKFTPRQWFRGRIFVGRSDLSPDGRHMIYFAMGGAAWAIPKTRGSWTAISRVPYLTAVALWGQGDTWSGGGIFTSNRSYWLDADDVTFPIRDESGLRRESKLPLATITDRTGWVSKKHEPDIVLEKPLANGWILRRTAPYRKNQSYALEQPEDQLTLHFPKWEWADWDRKRLVWVEDGCIRAARLGAHKVGTIRTLYDFNGMKPPQTRR